MTTSMTATPTGPSPSAIDRRRNVTRDDPMRRAATGTLAARSDALHHTDPAVSNSNGDGTSAPPIAAPDDAVRSMIRPLVARTPTASGPVSCGRDRSGTRTGELTTSRMYANALGARLRSIRIQQGLTLHDVEEKSAGHWKAVVVGSYERADRAVTMVRLAELAEFYGVPVSQVLPDDVRVAPPNLSRKKLTLDLQRLAELPLQLAGPLARYAAAVQSQRDNHNGKVLSIRTEDLQSLAVIYNMSSETLTEQLMDWAVLLTEQKSPNLDRMGRPASDAKIEVTTAGDRAGS